MTDYSNKLKVLEGEFLVNRVRLDSLISGVLSVKNKFTAGAIFVAVDEGELIKVLNSALELKLPALVLGSGLKYKFKGSIKGLLVVDKTRLLKIVGIKGKVGGQGIGVDEASVEVASGENMQKLNEFLEHHGLEQLEILDNNMITIGERVAWDDNLRGKIEKIKIWDQGQVYKCDVMEYTSARHVILSVIIKMKAK